MYDIAIRVHSVFEHADVSFILLIGYLTTFSPSLQTIYLMLVVVVSHCIIHHEFMGPQYNLQRA